MYLSVTQREVVSPKPDFVGFVGPVSVSARFTPFFVGFVGPVNVLVLFTSCFKEFVGPVSVLTLSIIEIAIFHWPCQRFCNR